MTELDRIKAEIIFEKRRRKINELKAMQQNMERFRQTSALELHVFQIQAKIDKIIESINKGECD